MSNMNNFFFLMCCLALLGAPLCKAHPSPFDEDHSADGSSASDTKMSEGTSPASTIVTSYSSHTEVSTSFKTRFPSALSKSQSNDISQHPEPTTTPTNQFFKKGCLHVSFVSGGLIILCFILLLCTLLLTIKVCRLQRYIKELSSGVNLISTSEYCVETGNKNKDISEADPAETTILMSDLGQTKQEDMGNGTTKEEVEKVEEAEKDGDATKSEEASPTSPNTDESLSSPKLQEDADDSKNTEASAASEGPKEAV